MFDSFIEFQARMRPRSPAVVTAARTVDFATFHDDIGRVAVALGPIHVGPDEAVSIDVSDLYQFWLLSLALARRAVATAPPQDHAAPFRIGDCPDAHQRPGLTVSADWFAGVLGGPATPAERMRPQSGAHLARVLCTSGTTGQVKRVGLSWTAMDAIVRNAPLIYEVREHGRWLPLTGPHTIFGLSTSLCAWSLGNAVLLLDRFGPEELDRFRPTLVSLVPYQLQMLVDTLPGSYRNTWPLRMITGGAALPSAVMERARSSLEVDLRSIYGASECSGIALASSALLSSHPTATGYVLPGTEVEIVGPDGSPLNFGQEGEVRVRSARLGRYLDTAPARASTFRDGWFHSGDVGRLMPDGTLFVEGRLDEQLNLGGDKLSPAVIEAAFRGLPGIEDIVAFSAPDGTGLSRCWLAVVAGPSFDGGTLEHHARAHLPWLGLMSWIQVDRIPRNAMGKVQRDQLREAVGRYPSPPGR